MQFVLYDRGELPFSSIYLFWSKLNKLSFEMINFCWRPWRTSILHYWFTSMGFYLTFYLKFTEKKFNNLIAFQTLSDISTLYQLSLIHSYGEDVSLWKVIHQIILQFIHWKWDKQCEQIMEFLLFLILQILTIFNLRYNVCGAIWRHSSSITFFCILKIVMTLTLLKPINSEITDAVK